MKLEQLQKHWDTFGRSDPLWAILTHEEHRDGRWQLDRFMQTGRDEVAELMGLLDSMGLDVRRGRALDFGCGVGRLTQALCEHFESCDGIDIAPSMIEQAQQVNRFPDRCRYHLNDRPDLSLFDDATFDFILSIIVLQHMEPRYSARYIREFIRVLRPGGTVVFQMPWGFDPSPAVTLPGDAWRASVEVEAAPRTVQVNRHALVSVRVVNRSPVSWPAGAALRAGNHWLDRRGRLVVNDDARAPLGDTLEPGAERRLSLQVRAPERPGRHLLEVDLVQEGVSWFARHGSPTVRIPVRAVRPPLLRRLLRRRVDGDTGDVPVMEMHCTPREEVVSIVESAGATVVDTLDRDSCGGGYKSLHYIVTTPG